MHTVAQKYDILKTVTKCESGGLDYEAFQKFKDGS